MLELDERAGHAGDAHEESAQLDVVETAQELPERARVDVTEAVHDLSAGRRQGDAHVAPVRGVLLAFDEAQLDEPVHAAADGGQADAQAGREARHPDARLDAHQVEDLRLLHGHVHREELGRPGAHDDIEQRLDGSAHLAQQLLALGRGWGHGDASFLTNGSGRANYIAPLFRVLEWPDTVAAVIRLTHVERQAVRWALVTLPIAIALGTLLLFAQVIQPFFSIIAMFFVAWILAFLLDAVVSWILQRAPALPRGLLAALVFFLVVILAILGLVLVASSVLSSLANILGDTASVDEAVARLIGPLQAQLDRWGVQVDLRGAVEAGIAELQRSGQGLLEDALNGGVLLFTQGTAVIFIAVVMVANKGRFLRFGQRLVPAGRENLWEDVAAATTNSFGGFVRGQFGIAALYGVVVGVIAFVFGVPFVALIAVVTAALQSIPYFGQLVSWAPLFLTALVFAPTSLVPVTIILVVGLLVIQNVISPRVLGSAVGMNPILVLAAVFVGAQVAGALGGVFGVPVLAVFATLFNAWLDQVRPPAAIDADRDRPLLPSQGGERVGQEAILEAAEQEAAELRAELSDARERIEALEATIEERSERETDPGDPDGEAIDAKARGGPS